MLGRDKQNYGEDFFDNTRMTFGEHIEELRTHLLRALKGFLIALVISLTFGKHVLHVIASPVETQLGKFYDRRVEKVLGDLIAQKEMPSNKPTGFVKVTFPKNQFEAAVQGKEIPPVESLETAETLEQLRKVQEELKHEPTVTLLWRIENPQYLAAYLAKAFEMVSRRPGLSTLRIEEAFMVFFKVSIYCGIVLSSPWIFWQIWSFIGAGLYPHEKKLVHVYLPFSLGLFLSGVAICQFLVIPKAIEALLWFNEWMGIEPDLRLSEWLSFAIMMPLVFGIAFQTPILMYFLNRVGIMNVEFFRKQRKIAFFVLAVVSALITPSVDAFSMLYLWVPLCFLYELGILICRFTPKSEFEEFQDEESDRLVEV